MTNFIAPGDSLTLSTPNGGVVSGQFYVIGTLLVCAAVTVTVEGDPFTCKTTGVFEVTKVGSQAWTEGAKVYWDAGNDYFTTTAGGNTLAGVAVEAVGSGAGETTGKVRLDGVSV